MPTVHTNSLFYITMRIVLSIMFIIVRGSGLITNIFISVKNTFENIRGFIKGKKIFLELRGRPDKTNFINKAQGLLNNIVMVD